MPSLFPTTKVIVASLAAIILAVFSGAHALSSTSVTNAPELAATVWPSNGIALEKLAYKIFAQDVRITSTANISVGGEASSSSTGEQFVVGMENLQRHAAAVSSIASHALRYEPLSPKAHSLIALAEKDPTKQRRIIELAASLTRRDLALQGLVLQSKIEANDYPGSIETLDQILRVNPQRRGEFYPFLTAALGQKATIPAFRALLADPLPWRDSFLLHALRDPAATRNLTIIRQSIVVDNIDFDRRLIAALVSNGEVQAAEALYRKLVSPATEAAKSSWATDYPPFDWIFVDQSGFRAQPRIGKAELEFVIDPGNGGPLASRLLALPDAPFSIVIQHEITPATSAKDLKLLLACVGQTSPFFEASFVESGGVFKIGERPRCPYVNLVLTGRAWTGSNGVKGLINSVKVTQF